ncbi:phenylacetate--CoA ligase family protein [[Eubacterium] hominis]|uniref:phenylacetate--CoA ligase family protein n=1 Tax=[Eubacterium] hominis TaxID=2764325 RepID=UPI003A4D242C
MSVAKKVYIYLPTFIQNCGVSIYGAYQNKQRFGKIYKDEMKRLNELNYSDLETQKKIQEQRFLELLEFAVSKSHFYKNFYKNIDINAIRGISDLDKLPILEKEILRKNINDFYTIPIHKGIKMFTGGTTGKSLEVVFTKEDMQKRYAYLHTWEKKHGILPDMKRATFSGRQILNKNKETKIFWRYNKSRNQMLYSTFDMLRENLPYYVESLNEFKPEVINGFVSSIYDLALFIKENDCKLTFTPKVVFTTSETLLPYQKREIENVFTCPVRNQYGSSEGAPFITECKEGKLHYNIDTGIIEEYQTDYGTEMLVTSFTTHGTPLIRYRIGDMWKLSHETCNCGSCHPIVSFIEGRQVDFLYAIDGSKVSLSHLADVIKGFPNSIVNMQFWQNDINAIEIHLVIDKEKFNRDKGESEIIKQMKYRFGNDIRISFIYVDMIPKEKSGKYALIKNNVLKK